jgi:hypothetical protein
VQQLLFIQVCPINVICTIERTIAVAPGKQTRAMLRELAGTAYRRELDRHLRDLAVCFGRWDTGEIDCFELSDKIHGFHDGVSRELYVMYERLKPEMAIARAIALGLLPRKEVPAATLSELDDKIEFFQSEMENS